MISSKIVFTYMFITAQVHGRCYTDALLSSFSDDLDPMFSGGSGLEFYRNQVCVLSALEMVWLLQDCELFVLHFFLKT